MDGQHVGRQRRAQKALPSSDWLTSSAAGAGVALGTSICYDVPSQQTSLCAIVVEHRMSRRAF